MSGWFFCMKKNRLYVLIRKDMKKAYQAVQAGHAVAGFVLRYPFWRNETLIYLNVANEKSLKGYHEKLGNFYRFAFYEPDKNYEMTALAVFDNNRRRFRHLKLMK